MSRTSMLWVPRQHPNLSDDHFGPSYAMSVEDMEEVLKPNHTFKASLWALNIEHGPLPTQHYSEITFAISFEIRRKKEALSVKIIPVVAAIRESYRGLASDFKRIFSITDAGPYAIDAEFNPDGADQLPSQSFGASVPENEALLRLMKARGGRDRIVAYFD